MIRRALQLALREMQAPLSNRMTRIGLLLAIVLLGISGPFGTFAGFNVGQRFGYWWVMVIASYSVGQGAAAFFIEILRPHLASRWPRALVAGVLTALPVTVVVIVVNGVAYQHLDWGESLLMWGYATVITMIAVIVFVGVSDLMAAPAEAPATAAEREPVPVPAPPPILERVPLPQRGRLLALSVEDHYVDIVTDRGKTLVLMRLADAMRETGAVDGLQIHRSHWVARDAVTQVHRASGKVTLELSNGMRLPVSRGFLPQARAAGLA